MGTLGQTARRVGAHQDLLRIGEKADSLKLVLALMRLGQFNPLYLHVRSP